jgi:DNA-binding beta-propeller fold protein YncE
MLSLIFNTSFISLFVLLFCLPVYTQANSSSSIVETLDGSKIYTANFQVGSITMINTKSLNAEEINKSSNESTQELSLGKDIRRLAFNYDESQLLVSDYQAGKIYWLDSEDLAVEYELETSGRPFGIVYDETTRLYWLTLFEGNQLLALNEKGSVVERVETLETPRGLALTKDKRLLVTHAMTGQVSIYDVASNKLQGEQSARAKLIRVIQLASSEHEDEFVSQGLPRVLDDIALSPDESEAWLPHLLWNFDHEFQFQSTIFPAVSIIDLTRGKEQERVEQRKELFKQINIIDNNNRTRIISNPHDAEFSHDGKKVYITLSGSEDLLVFDRSRAMKTTQKRKKKRSKRRQGKISLGAKAIQILSLPGDNPKGLLITNGLEAEKILVQNAISLDIDAIAPAVGSFGKAQVEQASIYKTVSRETQSELANQSQHRGNRLFNSANNNDNSQLPMAGDFWMSCNSCHLDGFNFTNKYLVENRGEDKYKNAILGHGRLNKMIVGDFLGDYLRIIQDTQGGMGHDVRDGAIVVDPSSAPQPALAMMADLHQYVTAAENLPRLTTWLRLEDGSRKTVHDNEWINSASCETCHSEMFSQWADSNHRLMGGSNPYFSVLEDLAAETEGEGFRAWCSSCHNPERVLAGKPFNGHKNFMFEKQGQSLKDDLVQGKHGANEGTGCLFCHRITKLEDAGGNAAMTVNLKDRQQYVFENDSNPILNWLGESQINAKPEEHKASYSQEFYKDEKYCKGCHNEFSPGLGAVIVDTWGEWEASSYNNPKQPEKHRGCIACHMHGDVNRIGENIPGISTDGGRIKDNVVTHQFTGANHFLLGLRNKPLEKMSIDLLKTSASLEQKIEDEVLTVRVNNIGAGHALPTGVADFRQFWLHVKVRDAGGNLVFESGALDEAGNLDENAHVFMKEFGDKEGKPVGLIFWRYEKLIKDTRIPADGYRDESFELPSNIKYPLSVSSSLMYRVYPQWVTDAVQKKFPELPDPEAIELNYIESEVNF